MTFMPAASAVAGFSPMLLKFRPTRERYSSQPAPTAITTAIKNITPRLCRLSVRAAKGKRK